MVVVNVPYADVVPSKIQKRLSVKDLRLIICLWGFYYENQMS